MSRYQFFILLAVVILVQATPASSQWPYLQIYPPVNESDSRTPLFYAAVFSLRGDYISIGVLPGVQIALDYINSEPSILPGYTLHYTLMDSQCTRSVGLSTYYYQLNSPPTKVGWLGSGCSAATIPTAELTQYYNITQVSCVSSSPDLKNRERFGYYFQLLDTEVRVVRGFFGIIKHYGWRKVRIIAQDESVFIAAMNDFKERLTGIGVNFTEIRFRTDDGIDGINTEFLDTETRIYVLSMYNQYARDILCEAYRLGFRYPKYVFMTYGWYADNWWTGPASSSQYNCTAEERATILPYTMGPLLPEFPADLHAEAEPGITASEFMSQYHNHLERDINKDINLASYINVDDFLIYSYACHEGTLAFAYALNKTIADLIDNSTLNREAAELRGLPEGETFTMANFTYNNSAVVSRMFIHLQNTSFPGISGSEVRFNDQGTRELDTVLIRQYQMKSDGSLFRNVVANVIGNEFQLVPNSTLMFPDGVPIDGIPIEEVVTVSLGLTVVYVILAAAGIVFAVVCLSFTLIFRKRKLIRLSSPNLNYIIILGAIVLYLNVITFVIPTTNAVFVAVLCNINPWLTSLGYSLCYGTILIKMVRVWSIFSKPLGINTPLFQDHFMALFVMCLAVLDLVILVTYTVVEGLRDNLGVKLTTNRELPEETFGLIAEVHQYFLYICKSDAQVIVYATLYGYKGFLQIIALLLAFRIRKVKVQGLDDSMYIAAAIYVTSIVLAVTIFSTYTLMDYVNVYPIVVGMGFLLGTTTILGLVFVPRMVGLYKDPHGKTITFKTTLSNDSSADDKSRNENNEIRQLKRRVTELENSLVPSIPSPNPDKPPTDDISDAVVGDSQRNGAHDSLQTNGLNSNTTKM